MKLVTVMMLEDCKGCTDGITVRPYYKDTEYNLPESLANSFISDLGVARNTNVDIVKAVTELKEKEEAELEATKISEKALREEAEPAVKAELKKVKK